MKNLLIVLTLVLSLVGTAVAEDKIYILGNRSVFMSVSVESAGQDPVIIDCSKKNNADPIGCIIATSSDSAKERTHASK